MPQTENCDLCSHKHNCSDVYEHLSKAKGPGVGFRVFIAFFVPIVVFIISLTVFEKISVDIAISENLKTAMTLLLSLTVTTLVMLVIKLVKLDLKK